MNANEMDFNPKDILWAPPPAPDVMPVEFTRGPQPGFRKPADIQLGNLALGVKMLFGTRFRRFRHSYAPLPEGHIRVLTIKPGEKGEPLELYLLSVPFEEPYTKVPPYEALSYEWDDGPPVFPVILRDYTAEIWDRFPVPEDATQEERRKITWEWVRFALHRNHGTIALIQANLRNALEHLRHKKDWVRLWADALCINQMDDDEKANQIARMGSIYNKAFNVRVWLGGESEQSDVAMDYVLELQGENALKNMFSSDNSSEEMTVKWPALFELMTSRWFSRRWVVQEIALAKKASVYCGEKKVSWADFSSAISTFMDRAKPEKLEQAPQQQLDELSGKKTLTSEGLRTLKGSGANALVAAKSDLVQFGSKGEVIERRQTLEELVSTLTAFDCGDPRDIVYAVLSVAAHEPQKDIQPHESKSLLQLYTEFTRYCAEALESLDMICRHWAPKNNVVVKQVTKSDKRRFISTLPTWIKTLEDSTFGTPDKVFRGQKEAVGLVGPPSRRLYKASGSRPPQISFGQRPALDNPAVLREEFDGTATAKGIKLGVVQEVSARLIPGIIPREALQLGGWTYALKDMGLTVEDVPDKLWRTLVANKTTEGLQPPPNYKLYCLKMLQLEDIHGDIHIDKVLARKDIDPSLSHFLQRVRDVTFNRKIFVAGLTNELFGLCPKTARKGDILCILYGCSVPVVLRPRNKRPLFGLDPKCNNDPAPPATPKASRSSTVEMNQEQDSTAGAAKYHPNVPDNNPWADHGITSPPLTGPSRPIGAPPARASTIAGGQALPDTIPKAAVKANPQKKISLDHANNAPELVVEGVFYQVIGECYIDYKMDGEACPKNHPPQWEEDFMLI